MNKDKFELTRKQLDMIFLLRIINAESDKNIKQSDLEAKYGAIFTRERIEAVLVHALDEGLVMNKSVNIGTTRSIIATLTKSGKEYISRVN